MLSETVEQMIDQVARTAKAFRAACGYSEEKRHFQSIAIIIAADKDEPIIVPTSHGSEREKRIVMDGVAKLAKLAKAPLVVLVNDTRMCNADKFCEHFGLPVPTNQDEWTQKYGEIVTKAGGLGNLPKELWEESLVIVAKSPVLNTRMRMLHYEQGEDDSIRWLDESRQEDGVAGQVLELKMLPDWWEPENLGSTITH